MRERLVKNGDLTVALGWAVVAGLLALRGIAVPIRTVLGLPMIFWLPGYTALEALVPRKAERLDVERVAISIALSLAICALGALALNLTSAGLRSATWATFLLAVTAIGAGVALARRTARPVKYRPRLRLRPLAQGVGIFTAVAAFVIAMVIGIHGAQEQAAKQSFSQLWMVPAGGRLTIGVRNEERQTRRATLRLFAGKRVVRVWRFAVAPGQASVRTVRRPRAVAGRRISVQLAIPGSASLRVWTWTKAPS